MTYQAQAQKNIEVLKGYNVKKIVTGCPHCYNTIKNEYLQFDGNFEVIHHTELIANLLKEGKLKIGKGNYQSITYHDPCYLGRHHSIYDEPREVLKKIPGLDLHEMADSRRDSLCCGGGGGRIWMETPKSERFSGLRLEQAIAIGAEVLVTSCPYCIANFEDSRLNREDSDVIEIKDITEIIRAVI